MKSSFLKLNTILFLGFIQPVLAGNIANLPISCNTYQTFSTFINSAEPDNHGLYSAVRNTLFLHAGKSLRSYADSLSHDTYPDIQATIQSTIKSAILFLNLQECNTTNFIIASCNNALLIINEPKVDPSKTDAIIAKIENIANKIDFSKEPRSSQAELNKTKTKLLKAIIEFDHKSTFNLMQNIESTINCSSKFFNKDNFARSVALSSLLLVYELSQGKHSEIQTNVSALPVQHKDPYVSTLDLTNVDSIPSTARSTLSTARAKSTGNISKNITNHQTPRITSIRRESSHPTSYSETAKIHSDNTLPHKIQDKNIKIPKVSNAELNEFIKNTLGSDNNFAHEQIQEIIKATVREVLSQKNATSIALTSDTNKHSVTDCDATDCENQFVTIQFTQSDDDDEEDEEKSKTQPASTTHSKDEELSLTEPSAHPIASDDDGSKKSLPVPNEPFGDDEYCNLNAAFPMIKELAARIKSLKNLNKSSFGTISAD